MATVCRDAWMEAWESDAVASAASRRSASRVSARFSSTRYYGREATARVPQPGPELQRRARPLAKPRLVTQRRRQWPMIAAALVFAALLLGVAVVSPMLLSARATAAESQVGDMESTEAQFSASIAALSSQIAALSAPERVAEQAAQLGLQPVERVYYLESGPAGTEADATVAGR
jgi:cell division protein FtsL